MLSPDPMNYWIVLLDIEDFSLRVETVQATLHDELYEVVRYAMGRARLDPDDCVIQDRGDGMLMLFPAQVKPGELLRELMTGLHDALADHQVRFRDEHGMRLRVGLHLGLVTRKGDRWTSTAINDLSRLVDAAPVKQVLKSAVRAHLVLVVSEEVHKSVVVGRYPGIDPAGYLPADFVTKHGEPRRGWVTVPGPEYSAPPGLPSATGATPAAAGGETAEGGHAEGKHAGTGPGGPVPAVREDAGGDTGGDRRGDARRETRRDIRLKNGDYVEGDKIVHMGADRSGRP